MAKAKKKVVESVPAAPVVVPQKPGETVVAATDMLLTYLQKTLGKLPDEEPWTDEELHELLHLKDSAIALVKEIELTEYTWDKHRSDVLAIAKKPRTGGDPEDYKEAR